MLERYPQVTARVAAFLERNQDSLTSIDLPARAGRQREATLSLVNEDKLRRILVRMLDEERFLGPHGIRPISRWHLDHPYVFDVDGVEYRRVRTGGVDHGHVRGNSNWRGPGGLPINVLLIRALLQHSTATTARS